MEILSNQLLKKMFGVSKLPITYYIRKPLCKANGIVFEAMNEAYNDLGRKEEITKYVKEMLSELPFKHILVVIPISDNHHGVVEMSQYNLDMLLIDTKHGAWISAPAFGKEQPEAYNQIKSWAVGAVMALTSCRTSVVHLCQGRALTPKKGKYKKQNFLYITDKKYESSHDTPGVKYVDSMYAFDVCGHWREYKNPEIKGHTPRGEVIMGKTWVTPYTKGEGKEKFNKIRIFLK